MALLPFSGSLYGGGASSKNFMLDSAFSALGIGLGDQLSQKLKDQEDERKRKLLQLQRDSYTNSKTAPFIGAGTSSLFSMFGGGA